MRLFEIHGRIQPKEVLQKIVTVINTVSDLGVAPEDLEVYWDGLSYAVRIKDEEIDLLFANNDISEDNFEEAEFTSWPPRSATHDVIKITETQDINNGSQKK